MAREKLQLTIGDCTYEIVHLRAKAARHALHIVTKAAAPVLTAGAVQAKDEDDAIQAMLGRLGEVLDGVRPEDVDRLVELFAEETKVITPQSGGVQLGLADIADDHFAGPRFVHQFTWLKECVKHNFSFLASALRTSDAPAAEGAEPGSQTTSTGLSTE